MCVGSHEGWDPVVASTVESYPQQRPRQPTQGCSNHCWQDNWGDPRSPIASGRAAWLLLCPLWPGSSRLGHVFKVESFNFLR